MITVIQRVTMARVIVDGEEISRIGKGMLVLLGIGAGDNEGEAEYLARKILDLRIFNDEHGKMNLSLREIGGEVLVVSQFTLLGDCRKGRRPNYSNAALPGLAKKLYRYFIENLRTEYPGIKEGIFGAMMKVELLNDGPVTLIVKSKNDGSRD